MKMQISFQLIFDYKYADFRLSKELNAVNWFIQYSSLATLLISDHSKIIRKKTLRSNVTGISLTVGNIRRYPLVYSTPPRVLKNHPHPLLVRLLRKRAISPVRHPFFLSRPLPSRPLEPRVSHQWTRANWYEKWNLIVIRLDSKRTRQTYGIHIVLILDSKKSRN